MQSSISRDPGFAVYLHWPFCESKCPYCDFNSHVRHEPIDEASYLTAYLRELDHMASLTEGRTVKSVFFGGGTPSLMQPDTVALILEHISKSWDLDPDLEVTIEANPSSVEAGRFQGYNAAGINRVSLGVQAFNDEDLRKLGRLHSVEEARKAIEIAKTYFERVSFDMIYARPQQSEQSWRAELQKALTYSASHLSLYQLTIEDGTPFATLHKTGKLMVPDQDHAHRLYEITGEMCDAANLPAYEISNHAQPGEESRHNLIYWRYGEYAGIGPGAHGRLIISGVRHALSTHTHPETWCETVGRMGSGLKQCVELSQEMQADEMLLMGLRLKEGLDIFKFKGLTGHMFHTEAIDFLQNEGLVRLAEDSRYLRTTQRGRTLLNSVITKLSGALYRCAQTYPDAAL